MASESASKCSERCVDMEGLLLLTSALCRVQRTLDGLIDRGDISSRDLDTRTMDALEGGDLDSAHPQRVHGHARKCSSSRVLYP